MSTRRLLIALPLLVWLSSTLHGQQLATDADRSQALTFFRLGQEDLVAERFEKAIESFTKAVQKDPLLSIAHYGIGQANMNLRRYPAAVKAYTDCIGALRKVHDLVQAGNVEADKRRDDEIHELRDLRNRGWRGLTGPQALAAEQHLRDLEDQRHAKFQPFRAPAETLLALGSAQFRDGDRDGAEANWKAATDVNPKYGEAHNNLAVVYMQTGRLNEAEQELKLAEKNGFNVNPQFKSDLNERQKAAKTQ
jgi:tetratricopeptide (TPR) repeat protein